MFNKKIGAFSVLHNQLIVTKISKLNFGCDLKISLNVVSSSSPLTTDKSTLI